MKISDLKQNPKNPRIIKDDKFKKLVKSLQEFPEMMEKRPMVCVTDTVDGKLFPLGGNMRLKALQELKYNEIPETWVMLADEWTEEKRHEFVIKDNLSMGDWDWDELNADFDLQQLEEWGLDLPDFEAEVLEAEVLEAEEDDFDVPEGGIETDIVLGDLFEIGNHRLLCGDSTDADQVAKLMNGEKADIALCDPPYGISAVDNNSRMKQLGWKQYENDSNINTAVNAFNLIFSMCDKIVFWGANHYANKLPNSAGWLIWDKQAGKDTLTYSMGEMAWTNILTNVQIFTHVWDGFRKETEKGEKRFHPSQKPVALHNWVLNKVDGIYIILDLFLGSGSTMVAAHQLKAQMLRHGAGPEILSGYH